MLFQAGVKFLPILDFFKFHVKGERSIERKVTFARNLITCRKYFDRHCGPRKLNILCSPAFSNQSNEHTANSVKAVVLKA